MKVRVALFILCASVGLNQAKVTVHGEINGHKFIDRQTVYAAASPNNYVAKGFTFPPVISYNFKIFKFVFWIFLIEMKSSIITFELIFVERIGVRNLCDHRLQANRWHRLFTEYFNKRWWHWIKIHYDDRHFGIWKTNSHYIRILRWKSFINDLFCSSIN